MSENERITALTNARFTHEMCLNRAHSDSDLPTKANMLRFAALARESIKTLKTVVVVG